MFINMYSSFCDFINCIAADFLFIWAYHHALRDRALDPTPILLCYFGVNGSCNVFTAAMELEATTLFQPFYLVSDLFVYSIDSLVSSNYPYIIPEL